MTGAGSIDPTQACDDHLVKAARSAKRCLPLLQALLGSPAAPLDKVSDLTQPSCLTSKSPRSSSS